jgi:hypothetical protein
MSTLPANLTVGESEAASLSDKEVETAHTEMDHKFIMQILIKTFGGDGDMPLF